MIEQKFPTSLTGVAPLRLLLMGYPYEFDPYTLVDGESDRDFMLRQAKRVTEVNDGAGLTYISAEEHNRIVAVWINDEQRPPISHFSPSCFSEIRKAEARWAAEQRRQRGE